MSIEKEVLEKSSKPDVEEVEIVEEVDFKDIEASFTKFISEVTTTTENITGQINVDELNEIGDDIIKAKEYLTSFAKGEKKSVREKAYSQLVTLPVIGGWAREQVEAVQHQAMKDSSVKEVLNEIFDSFDAKKKRLIELTQMAENIRNELVSQEGILQDYIRDLDSVLKTTDSPTIKMKALEMSIQAETSDKIIKDQVYNKINFILELMEALMIRMTKTLPAIKSQLLNETSIAGMISSIADSVKMMGGLQELTNEITKTSTENIQGLIIDVTKELTNGADVSFYEKSFETNQKFHDTLMNCEVKRIESNIKSFESLKKIGIDTSNQLESRVKSQRKALGMSLESTKEVLKEKLVVSDE